MTDTLRQKAAKGLLWGGMSNASQQLLNLVFGIVLGRLLTPSDYGMVGMISIFSLIANSIQESGFTQAVANRKEVTRRDLSSIFWFSLMASVTLYVILFFLAPCIADFYNAPELTKLARVSFLGFVISSLGTAHFAHLYREMKVRQRTIATLAAMVISGAVGITMAALGFSYWGLVAQNLTYITVTMVCFWHFSGFRPMLTWDMGPVREMFPYSSKILLTNIFTHINNNLFSVVLGKVYDEKVVGNYNQGNKWNMMGYSLIWGMVNMVAQPVMARVRDDRERLSAVFGHMLRLTCLLSFPLIWGLSLISDELIRILITDKWADASSYLAILAIGGTFIPISNLFASLLLSKGKSNVYLLNTIALGLCQMAGVLAIYPLGVKAMLYLYTVLTIAWTGVWYLQARRVAELAIAEMAKDIVPYMASAAVMYAAASLASGAVSGIYAGLAVKVAVSVAVYAGLMMAIRTDVVREVIALARTRHLPLGEEASGR